MDHNNVQACTKCGAWNPRLTYFCHACQGWAGESFPSAPTPPARPAMRRVAREYASVVLLKADSRAMNASGWATLDFTLLPDDRWHVTYGTTATPAVAPLPPQLGRQIPASDPPPHAAPLRWLLRFLGAARAFRHGVRHGPRPLRWPHRQHDPHHGRSALRAKLAAGVVALGCAAALVLGGLQAGDTVSARSQVAPVVRASGREHQRFLEQNLWLPDGTLAISGTPAVRAWDVGPAPDPATVAPAVWTYREDHRAGAGAVFVADQFTYREDRRRENVAAPFVADQFTYREDRRAP